jgi:ribosome-associated protein
MIDALMERIAPEIQFITSRSGGKGGQHVNKVESRVQLIFPISESALLTSSEKERLLKQLGNQLTKEGVLIISAEENRSQHRNRELALDKLKDRINDALKPVKKRKATKPTRASQKKRLKSKKQAGEKKRLRGKIDPRSL